MKQVESYEAIKEAQDKNTQIIERLQKELVNCNASLDEEQKINIELKQSLEGKERALIEVGQRIDELRDKNVEKENKRIQAKEENDMLTKRIKELETTHDDDMRDVEQSKLKISKLEKECSVEKAKVEKLEEVRKWLE
jgi:chromosome segregation ATPase